MSELRCQLSTLALAISALATHANAQNIELPNINVTAEEQAKQALGASIISEKDINSRPIINDVAQIIRTQPGVNLTANSTSGQRGNNRQIDIRGMGPENTLILIDGKPVNSRQSVRYGWRGERDTRGDTNWVPAEMIERIDVLRGPAAARYGNGAAGGVVNIITKQPTDKFSGAVTAFFAQPQHSQDGSTQRYNFYLAGPIANGFSFRVYGNYNKTAADAWDINLEHAVRPEKTPDGKPNPQKYSFNAGREGVKNQDINGLLRWDISDQQRLELELFHSQQKNIYAGDAQNNNFAHSALNPKLPPVNDASLFIGSNTNTMTRDAFSLTHQGDWNVFTTKSYLQYERTKNNRIDEGLAGGSEGKFDINAKTADTERSSAILKNLTFNTEAYIPFNLASTTNTVTVGVNIFGSKLADSASMSQATQNKNIPVPSTNRDSHISANLTSVYVEDNIDFNQGTIITPSLRFDHHSKVGSKLSPGINLWHDFNDNWALKAGIAQAYKAPNLYQLNPNYLLFSRGQGCWNNQKPGNKNDSKNWRPCFLMGNADFTAETSINSEIGVEFKTASILTNLTFFNNDYRHKIEAGQQFYTTPAAGQLQPVDIYQWENIDKAIVRGFEGSFNYQIRDGLNWNNNFTYMLKSENKANKEPLSVIPKYTINSSLIWRVLPNFDIGTTITFYGKQKPKKIDYRGAEIQDSEALRKRKAYSLTSVFATYTIANNYVLTFGIDNLFDKRLYREGNAQGVIGIPGAGANTYNEPGRAFNLKFSAKF